MSQGTDPKISRASIRVVPCTHCDCLFPSSAVERHRRSKHAVYDLISAGSASAWTSVRSPHSRCTILSCGAKFSDKTALQQHLVSSAHVRKFIIGGQKVSEEDVVVKSITPKVLAPAVVAGSSNNNRTKNPKPANASKISTKPAGRRVVPTMNVPTKPKSSKVRTRSSTKQARGATTPRPEPKHVLLTSRSTGQTKPPELVSLAQRSTRTSTVKATRKGKGPQNGRALEEGNAPETIEAPEKSEEREDNEEPPNFLEMQQYNQPGKINGLTKSINSENGDRLSEQTTLIDLTEPDNGKKRVSQLTDTQEVHTWTEIPRISSLRRSPPSCPVVILTPSSYATDTHTLNATHSQDILSFLIAREMKSHLICQKHPPATPKSQSSALSLCPA